MPSTPIASRTEPKKSPSRRLGGPHRPAWWWQPAILALLFFWSSLLFRGLLEPGFPTGTDALGHVFKVWDLARQWRQGRLTDWSWQWYAGYQPFLFYPPLSYVLPAFFLLLAGRLFLAFKLASLIAVWVAAAGMYYLALTVLHFARRPKDPVSLFAAATVAAMLPAEPAFRNFLVLKGEYADFWGFALTPWVLAWGIRFIVSGRRGWAAYLAGATLLFYVHGHWATAAVVGLLAFAAVFRWLERRPRLDPPQRRIKAVLRSLTPLLAVDVLFVLLTAPWTWGFFYFAPRVGNPSTIHSAAGQASAASLTELFFHGFGPWATASYLGAWLLLAASLAYGHRRSLVAALTAMTGLSLVIVLGPNTPLQRYLPIINLVFPERGLGVLTTGLLALAALGLDSLLRGKSYAAAHLLARWFGGTRPRPRRTGAHHSPRFGAFLTGIILLLWSSDLYAVGLPAGTVPPPPGFTNVIAYLRSHPPPSGERVAFIGPEEAEYSLTPALTGIPVLNGYLLQGSRLAEEEAYALSFWLARREFSLVGSLLRRWDVGTGVIDPRQPASASLARALASEVGFRPASDVGGYLVLSRTAPLPFVQPVPGEILLTGRGSGVAHQEFRNVRGFGFVEKHSSWLESAPTGILRHFGAIWLAQPSSPLPEGVQGRLQRYLRAGGTVILDADDWPAATHGFLGLGFRETDLHRTTFLRAGVRRIPFRADWQRRGWSGVTYTGLRKAWLRLPDGKVVAGEKTVGRGRLVALGLNIVFHAAYQHSRRERNLLERRLTSLLRPGRSPAVLSWQLGAKPLLALAGGRGGWLELAMGWTPWWHVLRGKRELPSFSSFGGATVVWVPPGTRALRLRFYTPPADYPGWLFLGLGLLTVTAAILHRPHRRREPVLDPRQGAALARFELATGWLLFLGGGLAGARLGAGYPPLQWSGFLLLGLYLGLFARNGLWFSLRRLWWRLPPPPGTDLPRVGLLIPARQEAGIIARTLRRLDFLDYPKGLLKIVVVTDGKEEEERRRRAETLNRELRAHLLSPGRQPMPEDREGLCLFLQWVFEEPLDANALPVYDVLTRRGPVWLLLKEAAKSSAWVYRLENPRAVRRHLQSLIRQHGRSLQAYRLLAGGRPLRLLPPLGWLPMQRMVLSRLNRAELEKLLPTTASVAAAFAEDNVQVVTVPSCFDHDCLEEIGCVRTDECAASSRWAPSSKGRALNYGLGFLRDVDIVGVYDADARPEREVLLKVASFWQNLNPRERQHFFMQGPVFQVRNFYRLGLIAKPTALYQALTHDAYYPVWLSLFPFPGGTNMFFAPRLAAEIGGFDHHALSEDLNFGLRVWFKWRIKPSFLPSPASEQTPALFSALLKQRRRWAYGYLDGMALLRRQGQWGLWFLMLLEGPLSWTIGFSMFSLGATGFLLMLAHLALLEGKLPFLAVVGLLANIPFFLFSLLLAVVYFDWMDLRQRPGLLGHRLSDNGRTVGHVPFLFLMMWPWFASLFTYRFSRSHQGWVKTERTAE